MGLNRPFEYLIPLSLRLSPGHEFKARALIYISVTLAAIFILGTLSVFVCLPDLASENRFIWAYFGIGVWCLLSPFILKLTASIPWACVPVLTGAYAVPWTAAQINGSLRAPAVACIILMPMVAQIMGSRKLRNLTLLVNIMVLSSMLFLESQQIFLPRRPVYSPRDHTKALFVVYVVLSFGAFLIAIAYERIRELTDQRLIQVSRLTSLSIVSGGIAHELNTPIAAILLGAEALEEMVSGQDNQEELLQIIGMIRKSAQKTAKIVKTVRSYSQEENLDQLSVHSLQEVLDQAFALCKEQFTHHTTAFRVVGQADRVQSRCRPVQLMHALLNLFQNSLEAVTSMKERWVTVQIYSKKATVEIRISDSGKGLSAHAQENLFTPFFTTKKIGTGLGLGLASSASVIAMHGGRLHLDTKATQTTFVVTLPRIEDKAAKIPTPA
ncbi:MAG: sensor histidine kinase [Bdellovibrionales bacterium]